MFPGQRIGAGILARQLDWLKDTLAAALPAIDAAVDKGVVSTVTLFDGPVITEIEVLPASASRLLYGGREAEAGSDGSAAPLSRFIGFVVVPGSRVAERPPFACAPASGGCR
jgi:hypothetical protein